MIFELFLTITFLTPQKDVERGEEEDNRVMGNINWGCSGAQHIVVRMLLKLFFNFFLPSQ